MVRSLADRTFQLRRPARAPDPRRRGDPVPRQPDGDAGARAPAPGPRAARVLAGSFGQTLEGSFSAVSKRIFAAMPWNQKSNMSLNELNVLDDYDVRSRTI